VKVSVITAVRNGASAIAPTLRSVFDQRFPALEHVIVDGASTDGTVEIVRREKRTVGAVISERDSGVYDAFNKGLAAATGDLIGFLNAGDRYVDERAIDRLATAIEASKADAVFADVAFVDAETGAVQRRFRSTAFSPARISYGYMPAHPTLFVRRAVFERFGEFDPSFKIAGDFEFVARAFGRGGISFVYVPETLVYMEPGGLSDRGWKSKWTITKEIRRACKANGISSGWIRLMSRLPAKYVTDVLLAKWRRPSAL
jgi:glycosyltransferase involved in cell wall biosynthesis